MTDVSEPRADLALGRGTEPIGDDVLPRLVLWLADVAAEAALAPLQTPERLDDQPTAEWAAE